MIKSFKNTFRRVMVKYVPSNRLVSIETCYLKLIPDQYETQEMCSKTVEKVPWLIRDVPACLYYVPEIYPRPS